MQASPPGKATDPSNNPVFATTREDNRLLSAGFALYYS
jgi:hypothetical protein